VKEVSKVHLSVRIESKSIFFVFITFFNFEFLMIMLI
jgi:hypothetical protein